MPMKHHLPIISTIVLSLLCVAADYCLRRASDAEQAYRSTAFLSGLLIYALSAFGWVYVYQHMQFATVGPLFSVLLVLAYTAIGIFDLKELPTKSEFVGIGCAILAVVLLGKFKG